MGRKDEDGRKKTREMMEENKIRMEAYNSDKNSTSKLDLSLPLPYLELLKEGGWMYTFLPYLEGKLMGMNYLLKAPRREKERGAIKREKNLPKQERSKHSRYQLSRQVFINSNTFHLDINASL